MAVRRGRSLNEALAGKDSVAEGVLNAQSAKALADRAGVEMPIIDATGHEGDILEAIAVRGCCGALRGILLA